METIITLVVAGLTGWWCYYIAGKKGRDQVTAFVVGLLLGIFGVIIYAVLSPTEDQKIRDASKLLKDKKELLESIK